MPKNKFQDVIYTIIMASVMVYGMVAYNIVLNTGSMQNWVFLAVFHEWPIMTVIAILLELVFVGKLAMKVAFRLVNPREASQTSIMLAISAASVWLMCPCMSFFATLLFKDSHNSQFFAIWVQTTVMNFPMALLWQFFAAGPLVRRIFGLLFRENADKSSAAEMESVYSSIENFDLPVYSAPVLRDTRVALAIHPFRAGRFSLNPSRELRSAERGDVR